MRDLNGIKKNAVFQLAGIANYAIIADKRGTAQIGTVTNLGVLAYDCGGGNNSGGSNSSGFGYPDVGGQLMVNFCVQRFT